VSGAAPVVQWLHRNSFERRLVLPVFHELHQHFISVQVNELLGDKFLSKFLFQHFRVGLPNPKGNRAAHVAQNGLPDGQGKLIDILVRQRHAETVFSSFGQQGSKSIGRKILKLINKQEEIAAVIFGLAGACHCRQLELRYQERSEQVGFVVTYCLVLSIGYTCGAKKRFY
jgi:hypothetical protein